MPEVELPKTDELEEIRGKGFTKRVALSTAIVAVLLAITSLGGNKAMKEMLLAQQQSSDQWAFYQSKVVREHFYRTQKIQMETALLERGEAMRPDVRRQYEALLKKAQDEELRYGEEKKKIEEEARRLEHERDLYRSKDPYFEYAEALLQISIVLASIAIIALSRQIYSFSVVAAVLGTVFMVNGYILIFRLPFFQ
ncbi:MAG TPA: DUF4337 domain-containing protein [Thermodesulfovibrionales bacterium]|jgi:hypothetical protein|nr:DUF4337 domain-containing protein [Thermodesulfovibrionales bacterium]